MALIDLDHEIEFQWTEQQSKILHSNFTRMFEKAEPVYGEGTASVVLRYMLAASRIGMVLTAVEAFEDDQLHSSKILIANDRVMYVVIDVLETCSQHSFLMMTNIKANSKTRPLDMKSMNILRFYNALPDGKSFKTNEAISIGRSLKISDTLTKFKEKRNYHVSFDLLDQKFVNEFLTYMVSEHEYVRNHHLAKSENGLKPEIGLANETAIKRLKNLCEYYVISVQ